MCTIVFCSLVCCGCICSCRCSYMCLLYFHKHTIPGPSELTVILLVLVRTHVYGHCFWPASLHERNPIPMPYQAHLSQPEPHVHVSSMFVGLGFRQVGQRAFLMVSTNKKVYSIYVSENDKKVVLSSLLLYFTVYCGWYAMYGQCSSHSAIYVGLS